MLWAWHTSPAGLSNVHRHIRPLELAQSNAYFEGISLEREFLADLPAYN